MYTIYSQNIIQHEDTPSPPLDMRALLCKRLTLCLHAMSPPLHLVETVLKI